MKSATLMSALGAAAWLAAGTAAAAMDDKKANDLMNKAGCAACHKIDAKSVGPAYKDVSKKYKGQKDVVAKVAEKVRKGGAGVYGPVPMPPNPVDKISDADLKELTEWILKL
jgi:cytochrome c